MSSFFYKQRVQMQKAAQCDFVVFEFIIFLVVRGQKQLDLLK
jgi:hypothetical protein